MLGGAERVQLFIPPAPVGGLMLTKVTVHLTPLGTAAFVTQSTSLAGVLGASVPTGLELPPLFNLRRPKSCSVMEAVSKSPSTSDISMVYSIVLSLVSR